MKHPQVATFAPVEEELFGEVYVGSGLATDNSYSVKLTPLDGETQGRLFWGSPGGFDGEVPVTSTHAGNRRFGWFDPAASDGPCRTTFEQAGLTEGEKRLRSVLAYLNSSGYSRVLSEGTAETHPPNAAQLEPHCVRPGKYTIGLGTEGEAAFVVDYLAVESNSAGSGLSILHALSGAQLNMEADAYSSTDSYADLRVYWHLQAPGQYSDSPILEIENAGAVRTKPDFVDGPSPITGSTADWFRFSPVRSTTTWNAPAGPSGNTLARLFFDFGVNDTVSTGFWDFTPGTGIGIRTHRFASHVPSPRCVTVALEIKRPDEDPIDLIVQPNPHLATRQVGIGMPCPSATDLVPVRVTPSVGQVPPGGGFGVAVRTQNQGLSSAPGSWSGAIYLSTDEVCCTGDQLIGSYVEGSAIAGGLVRDRTASVVIASGTAPGAYRVLAKVDIGGTVAEANESNNTLAGSATVVVTAPAPVPTSVIKVAGDGATTTVGTQVTPAPKVRVLAADGTTRVPGVTVVFGSPSGGSQITGPNAVTDQQGEAQVGSWTLGSTAGTYTMLATVQAPGVSGNPATFTAQATTVACRYTPEGPVLIQTGTWATFGGPFSGCTGYTVSITPTSTNFGFTKTGSCTTKSKSWAAVIFVRACGEGESAAILVKNPLGAVVQTIEIESFLP